MSRFNLIEEKWIPVRFPEGRREELGIRDVLLQSKDIAAIEDPSPLVVAALHRFLLAVLYRALKGPTGIDEARKMFRDGLPQDEITSYLEEWRDRFWLFDEKYPFGQNPKVPKDEIEPWTKLTAEHNATSNKVLFDHIDTMSPGARPPGECARWLISTMSFSIAGGRGYYPSPSPNAMMCIPVGRNFFETLCYNLVPYPNRDVMLGDSALWEREPESLPLGVPKKIASGYADIYTWQSRMIFLEELPSGQVSLTRFVAGLGFENPSRQPDPMQPYKADKIHGRLPIQFREDRGTWRDFDSLLPDDTELAPLTVQHSLRLSNRNIDSMPKSVLVLGLRYDPPSANVDFWRMERFSLPEALAKQHGIRVEIKTLLTEAEESQKSLWIACNSFARNVLSRGERRPDANEIKGFVKQLTMSSSYWAILESKFHEILRDYAIDRDSDDIRYQWLIALKDTLNGVWNQHRMLVSMGDAWTIRALVKSEQPVLRRLRELNEEIVRLHPKEDAA